MSDERDTYRAAADFFVQVVERVRPDRWANHGLGVWTIRDLVGHTSRAFTNVERDLVQPVTAATTATMLTSAVDYFVAGLATPGISESVADRGREAGASLGDDPLAAVRELRERVLSLLDATPDAATVPTPFGTLTLPAYLPTKTFELTVHSLDIAAAIGSDALPPTDALSETLTLACQVAIRRSTPANAALLLRALTGRAALPAGFNAF